MSRQSTFSLGTGGCSRRIRLSLELSFVQEVQMGFSGSNCGSGFLIFSYVFSFSLDRGNAKEMSVASVILLTYTRNNCFSQSTRKNQRMRSKNGDSQERKSAKS